MPPYSFAKNGRTQPSWTWLYFKVRLSAPDPKILLFWDSSFVCPSTVSPLRVLSGEASFPSVGSCHGPDMGRPRGFAPPRRVTPRIGLRVYYTPLPVLEFATFLRKGDRESTEALPRTGYTFPRNAFHTPRRIPLASSRTASLQPLPSCCYLPLHTK